jgi:Transposase IS4
VATKNTSDLGDGFDLSAVTAGPKKTGESSDSDDNDEQKQAEQKEESDGEDEAHNKIEALVLDILKPYFGSNRIVNMDNYYTSPMVGVKLLENAMFMRGTCRSTRVGFPPGVTFTKTEAKNLGRGAIKCMVDRSHHTAAMGWTDGNPVHFVTTADGIELAEVQRRVGRDKKSIRAPAGIKKYNRGMQAVDRNDQLRQLFSLSARHGFKKYYVKIGLGLIDMAIVQGWLHFKLANPDEAKKQTARYDFMNELGVTLMETDWEGYLGSQDGFQNDKLFRAFVEGDEEKKDEQDDEQLASVAMTSVSSGISQCFPVAVQHMLQHSMGMRRGLGCQVCVYEGRGTGIIGNVAICMQHRIRCCTVVRKKEVTLANATNKKSWMAPENLTCWQKAHEYYIPQKLFLDEVNPFVQDDLEDRTRMKFQAMRVGSDIYKKRNKAFGIENDRRGRKARKKRKQQNQVPPARMENLEQQETIQESVDAISLEEFGTPEQNDLDSDDGLGVMQMEQL